MAPGKDTTARAIFACKDFTLLSFMWALNISEGARSFGAIFAGHNKILHNPCCPSIVYAG